MTSRFARLCLAASSPVLTLSLLAQTPPPLPTNPQPAAAQPAQPQGPGQDRMSPALRPLNNPNDPTTLNFPDADMETVISLLEKLTGKIVIRPQQLNPATHALKYSRQLPKWEAIIVLETVLALNNIGIVPMGDNILKIVNLNQVRQEAPEMLTGSAFDFPASGRAASKFFQLEFARAQEVSGVIATSLNQYYGGPVVLPAANALFITDSISNLQRVERLLEQIDRPNLNGMKPKFYQLAEVKASDVVNKIRGIITGSLTQQIGTGYSLSADDRTNQIILVADPRQHEFFDDIVNRLDRRADPNTRNEVVYLKHAKAKDVVDVISKIISSQTTAQQRQNSGSVRPGMQPTPAPIAPGAPPAPVQAAAPAIASASNSGEGNNEFSALMSVTSDERTNSVVVSGTADDIRLVKGLLEKLDITLQQVRIEVVIAEVTLEDNDASGISALGLKLEGDKLVGFSGILEGASDRGASITNGTLTRPGPITGGKDLAFELSISSSLRNRNNSIITVPAIVTSHGKKAEFFNGETRPVITGSIVSGSVGGTTSTTTQQEIGTTLTVEPFIGVDGSVQLDITQDVQDVIGEVAVDSNTQYIIGKRKSKTYNTAKSGDIIVIGGFRKNTSVREKGRLGPIPIIGDLFGPRKKSNARQELVFFVRPIVLTSSSAVDNADALKRIEKWSSGEAVKQEIDPKYVPKEKTFIDKVLDR